MPNIARATRRLRMHDSGLSLVEVVVAISLITIVATASGTLVLNGIAAGATVERRQVAVTIASGAMEAVNAQSVAKSSSTGVSALYTGRTKAAVDAAWAANSTLSGVPKTYEAWDPSLIPGAPTLPITVTTIQAGTTYTVTTIIGACYLPTTGAGDCAKVTGNNTNYAPLIQPSATTILIRAVVVVKWTAGQTCASGCSYAASTIIDPHDDLEWVSHG